MTELLDWVEKEAKENINFRIQIAETLAKEATTTLTLLLAGIGASTAFVINDLSSESISKITFAVGTMSLWLIITAALLVILCILTKPIQVPANEPMNIYDTAFSASAMREAELKNLQARITLIARRNGQVSIWLDRCRIMAIISPLIMLIALFFLAPVLALFFPALAAVA